MKLFMGGKHFWNVRVRPPKICFYIKAKRTLENLSKSTFSELCKLIKGLQQSKECLLKKNSLISERTMSFVALHLSYSRASFLSSVVALRISGITSRRQEPRPHENQHPSSPCMGKNEFGAPISATLRKLSLFGLYNSCLEKPHSQGLSLFILTQ